MSETAATTDDRRAFYLRKAHSLSGIVPIGGFLLVHLYSNHAATVSPLEFDKKVEWINNMPFVLALANRGYESAIADVKRRAPEIVR